RRQSALHEHAAALPRYYQWYADPAGATEIAEMRAAGHKVLPGNNSLRLGIQAVTARIQTGRLKVSASCTNLAREARLYRYPGRDGRGETGEGPVDEHNHALAALRYLILCLDARHLGRLRGHAEDDKSEGKPCASFSPTP